VAPYVSVELADLRRIAERNNGFPRDAIAKMIDGRETRAEHGPGDMPIWGDAFTEMDGRQRDVDAKVGALVDFLQSIQHATNAP